MKITLFEDRKKKFKLNDLQKQTILEIKDIIGPKYITLEADGSLIIKHLVGFFVYKDIKIQILPKVFQDELPDNQNTDEEQEALKVLWRLLHYTGFLNVKETQIPKDLSVYDDLLEIFIYIFIINFLQLFNREIHRNYVPFEENLPFIKGKILFNQTIQLNSFKKHLHYVQYDEYSLNNLLNQIFKTVILNLIHVTNNSNNKKNLLLALTYLEEVDFIKLSPISFDKVKFNRLNETYKPLFNLAKLFYHNKQPGFSEGDENTYSFLVPLNELFECFAYTVLDRKLDRNKLQVLYQKPQYYLAIHDEKKYFLLKPDIVIKKDNSIVLLIDAKYKNPYENNELSIVQTDIYQVITYSVIYNCNRIVLLYPCFSQVIGEPLTFKINSDDNQITLSVLQVDIKENNVSIIEEQLINNLLRLLINPV